MNMLFYKRLLLFFLIFTFTLTICEAQSFNRPRVNKLQRNAPKKPKKSKVIKIAEPRSVGKAKKKAEAVERQNKKEYAKFVKENQKRSLEIQVPEVRERMKNNMKTADANYKNKRKIAASAGRKTSKKYSR
jgi:biopolymer transport protein ExbB/TolQ